MNNEVLEGNGFWISYNPCPLGSDSAETALCIGDENATSYLILNGDFRQQYAELVDKGLSECIEFYKSKKAEFQSFWSSDRDLNGNEVIEKLHALYEDLKKMPTKTKKPS